MTATAPPENFGTGSLFLADSRLALMMLNHARYAALQRAFGVSREQANLVTAAILLTGASVGVAKAGQVMRQPIGVSRTDAGIGAFLLRDAAIGVTGPGTGAVPGAVALITFAVAGRVALPALRRAMEQTRATERRIRMMREQQYARALRAARAARAAGQARVADPR